MSNPKSPPPAIDGFSYVEGIGGGGFADVFLYTQHSTGRRVAVKVLRAEHLSDRSLRQFETEARVMAGVSTHPYIVTIHDAGIAADGRPYLVMEHYPQPHFGRRAAGGHLPISEVLRVGVQIASAVETAHRAGILHRDIKPANILTSTYGDPGLTDFGIAGVQTEEGMDSAAGVSYGFSAPEVLLDERATGSVATDVYALGATLYALLSGRSPIFVPGGDNSTGTLARRVAAGDIQPLRRPDAPRSLEHLVAACLSAQPSNRPRSAAELAAALRDIEQELRLPLTPLVLTGSGPAAGAPPSARPQTPEDGTRRKPRVIDVEGGRLPTTSMTPPGARSRAGTRPAPSELREPQVSAPSGVLPTPGPDRDATVLRSRPPATAPTAPVGRPAPPDADGPTPPGPAADLSATRRRLVAVAAVICGLALVGLSLTVWSGDGDPATEATTPTRPSTVPSTLSGMAGEPEDVRLVPNADGSVTVEWAPPVGSTDPGLTYTVFRTDSGHEDDPDLASGIASLSHEVPAEVFDTVTDPKGLCVKVQANLGGTARTSRDEACIPIGARSVTTIPSAPATTTPEATP